MSVERDDFASRASSLFSSLVVNPQPLAGSMAQYYQKQFLSLRGVAVCVGRGNDAASDRVTCPWPWSVSQSVRPGRECATALLNAVVLVRQTKLKTNFCPTNLHT